MDDSTTAEPSPRASLLPALLGAQAGLLAAFGVACVAAGALGLGLACVLAAAVAGGLASSIHEGLPGAASTVLGFEGAVVATAAQIRRPVPSQ